ncbi:hypothetical protein GCM10010112_56060 [Actinoplanes lobatus]|uniref:Uncharacterized protein n=1 Tax=Actinoplanes lobatus TaxID=113568 RepID=A0A7W7MGD6_9ACTN|nr:hypothetical protein [Actinoplanes lobatus]MBB4749176.1 hypothetical protein [Actinoplanes lobatus]GGN80465.1 hypothetical protein GCM10010112_56060 [Actinoplanes lobatus]
MTTVHTVPVRACCGALLSDLCGCSGIPPQITEWPATPASQRLRAIWEEFLRGPATDPANADDSKGQPR